MTEYWHSLLRDDLDEVSVFGDFPKAIRTWFCTASARWPYDLSRSVKTCCCLKELDFIKLELDTAVVSCKFVRGFCRCRSSGLPL